MINEKFSLPFGNSAPNTQSKRQRWTVPDNTDEFIWNKNVLDDHRRPAVVRPRSNNFQNQNCLKLNRILVKLRKKRERDHLTKRYLFQAARLSILTAAIFVFFEWFETINMSRFASFINSGLNNVAAKFQLEHFAIGKKSEDYYDVRKKLPIPPMNSLPESTSATTLTNSRQVVGRRTTQIIPVQRHTQQQTSAFDVVLRAPFVLDRLDYDGLKPLNGGTQYSYFFSNTARSSFEIVNLQAPELHRLQVVRFHPLHNVPETVTEPVRVRGFGPDYRIVKWNFCDSQILRNERSAKWCVFEIMQTPNRITKEKQHLIKLSQLRISGNSLHSFERSLNSHNNPGIQTIAARMGQIEATSNVASHGDQKTTLILHRQYTTQNGEVLESRYKNGSWITVVVYSKNATANGIIPGDQLIREYSSGTAMTKPDSAEKLISSATAKLQRKLEFAVLRQGKITSATLELVDR